MDNNNQVTRRNTTRESNSNKQKLMLIPSNPALDA